MNLQGLLEAVREVCPRGLWSQGVTLARERAVTRERGDGSELVLRVAVRGAAIAPTVVLYPEDGEWDCNCGGRFDACAHVAAAVIALNQEQLDPGAGTELHYRFERSSGELHLRRMVVAPDGTETRLTSSLFSVAAGRARDAGADLRPTQSDLEIDRLLGSATRTRMTGELAPALLSALAGCERVSLDGHRVSVSGEPVLPRGSLTDGGAGVRLAVVADPLVDEIVSERIGLCRGVLHPLGHTQAAGERWEALPLVRDYAPEELGELVTQMLPALRRDIAVEVRSVRLPRASRDARPRIHLDVSGDGERISVLPTLVYGDPVLARIDGDRLVQLRPPAPVRDRRAEADLVAGLRDRLNMVPGRRVTAVGGEARALVERVRAFQRGEDPDRIADSIHEVALIPRLAVREQDGDRQGEDGRGTGAAFDLWFDTSEPVRGEIRRASAAGVMAAWQNGLDLIPLEGGGWAPLPADFLARHGQRILGLLACRGEGGRVGAVAVPSLASLCDALDLPRPRAAERLAALLEPRGLSESVDVPRDWRLPAAALPSGFTGELRTYQRAGVDWLCFLRAAGFGAVLADDMGLGKTVQALAAIDGRALIVCPTSVLHNWAGEIARFRPDLSVCLYHGPRRALDPAAHVVVTSYALLRSDRDALAGESWRVAILDEAQAIKNPDSQAAHAAFSLRADFRVALTGTPVENRLEELWSICHFTVPGLLGDRSDFQRRIAAPIAAGRADATHHLRDLIRPFVLRRLKRDVAPELPPRTESVLEVELDPTERVLYDSVRAATRADLVAQLAAGAGVMAALEALLRLRQAACHGALLPGQAAPTSSKLTCLIEALDTAVSEGHKALVFSQWTSLLDLTEPHLETAGIRFTRLDGSTVDRAGVVADFQADDGAPVLLASLKAGGTGLNLTAADHVFILDPWWNPAAEDQAADRAHRIGQDRPVSIYRLVARETVEERLLALQARKRALADAALGQADRAASLTREDLLALLD